METTDSAMKRTMVVLMTTLFAMFLGIIYLANYVS
jgi:preprotein translocase subunit SecG